MSPPDPAARRPSLERVAALMVGAPTPAARRRAVAAIGRLLDPLRVEYRLPACAWRAGTAAMKVWGRCLRRSDGSFTIVLRLHRDGGQGWRRPGAVVATALHELAHLRERGHTPRFWSLLRQLLDEAAARGLYHPSADDPSERAQGDRKLRGSAAQARAEAVWLEAAEQRRAAREFSPGLVVRVGPAAGRLAGQRGRVERRGRTRVLVAIGERRYWIPALWLERLQQAEAAHRDLDAH